MVHRIQEGTEEFGALMEQERAEEVGERLRSNYLDISLEDFKAAVDIGQKLENEGSGVNLGLSDKNKDILPEVTLVHAESWLSPGFEDRGNDAASVEKIAYGQDSVNAQEGFFSDKSQKESAIAHDAVRAYAEHFDKMNKDGKGVTKAELEEYLEKNKRNLSEKDRKALEYIRDNYDLIVLKNNDSYVSEKGYGVTISDLVNHHNGIKEQSTIGLQKGESVLDWILGD